MRRPHDQVFLADEACVGCIVGAMELGGLVLEVGPGRGALTREMLARGARVVAVEIDGVLARTLHPDPRLSVVVGDFLRLVPRRDGLCLVSAVPYSLTSRFVRHVKRIADRLSRAYLVLQREVAERLTAFPGTKRYGAASVLVQDRFETTLLLRVPREAFSPRPDVDSALLRLVPRGDYEPTGGLETVVKSAFSQRRKTLANALAPLMGGRTLGVLHAAGVLPSARAETVPLDGFRALARAFGDADTR